MASWGRCSRPGRTGLGIDGQPLQARVQVWGPHPRFWGEQPLWKPLFQHTWRPRVHSQVRAGCCPGASLDRAPGARCVCGGPVPHTPSKLCVLQGTPAGRPLNQSSWDTRYLPSRQILQVEAQSPRLSPPPTSDAHHQPRVVFPVFLTHQLEIGVPRTPSLGPINLLELRDTLGSHLRSSCKAPREGRWCRAGATARVGRRGATCRSQHLHALRPAGSGFGALVFLEAALTA